MGCSLFLCFLSCLENWYIFFVSGGGGKAEMARLNVWLFEVLELLVCGDTYTLTPSLTVV